MTTNHEPRTTNPEPPGFQSVTTHRQSRATTDYRVGAFKTPQTRGGFRPRLRRRLFITRIGPNAIPETDPRAFPPSPITHSAHV